PQNRYASPCAVQGCAGLQKTLTNASNLLDLIDRAPASVLRVFSGRPACQALGRGYDWSQDESALPGLLLEHTRSARTRRWHHFL
ncbi:hypothetical protein, partial [Ralstonia pseudosolanacearum]|uniref:hypothetical protein n=1 Tax=Ralstonia pseudosolanacearum TaxID=1310165 RepID=UPI001E2AFB8B